MSRSRISLLMDEAQRLFIVRYFGDIEGGEINDNLMEQLSHVEGAWTYDSVIDMRRYEGTVRVGEIEALGQAWALFAQGRDRGCFTAIISSDTLVRARRKVTQAFFPTRNLEYFANFDQGLEWIRVQRGYQSKTLAVSS